MFKAFQDSLWGIPQNVNITPTLEVIARRPKIQRFETPVVFIHGAFTGAWCWDEYFLPYLAERGVLGYALSLRGHGKSGGQQWLYAASLADYVDDLARVLADLDRPAVLVGHSMGGMVVQKYLEQYNAPGVVLMASVPPGGLALPTLQMMLGDPWLLTQMSMVQSWNPSVLDLQAAKRAVFSGDLPEAELLKHTRRFRSESQRAIWDMTVTDLPRNWLMNIPPLLVLGAENDALFPPSIVEATALSYGAEAEIFPAMAHAMMLERRWQAVADRLVDWLEERGF